MCSQPNAVLVYDADLQNELWVDKESIDLEIHSELEPEEVLRNGFLWEGMKIEFVENPEKHLREALMFPATWNAEANRYFKRARHALAEYLLDECVDFTIYEEIKNIILSRYGEKKGA